jgi:hypothetical protein
MANGIKRIRSKIRSILTDGMDLSPDTVAFIDSTFFRPGIERLRQILQEDSDCEAATLIELLFSPDQAAQLAVEEKLGELALTPQEELRLHQDIARMGFDCRFRFPDDRGFIAVGVTETTARVFVTRLNLTKTLDANLLQSIQDRLPPEDGNRIRVKIRNMPFSPGPSAVWFLCRMLRHLNPADNELDQLMDVALHFLSDVSNTTKLFDALMVRKKMWLKCLHLSSRNAAMLTAGNIETWLVQGKRFPAVDPAEARRMLNRIDRISLAVFGKTENYDPDFEEENFGPFESKSEIIDMLRSLF